MILFVLNMNDVSSSLQNENSRVLPFADDTSLSFMNNAINYLQDNLLNIMSKKI